MRRRETLILGVYVMIMCVLFACAGCTHRQDPSKNESLGVANDKTLRVPLPELDPGCVAAVIQIERVSELDSRFVCDLEILEVVGQGPRSRPLARGSRLEAAIPKHRESADSLSVWMHRAQALDAVLCLSEIPQHLQESVPEWMIVELTHPHNKTRSPR